MKYATLFSGGGLFETGIAMSDRPSELIYAIENDKNAIAVWKKNHKGNLIDSDIMELFPDDLPSVDYIHASPPCQSFSVANRKRFEKNEDIDLAHAISAVMKAKQPVYFTLENVANYRNSKSFNTIVSTLYSLDYCYDWKVVNMTDYGIPQNRKRLILVASRSSEVLEKADVFFGKSKLVPCSWKSAISDLIPTFSEVEPTAKEKKALLSLDRTRSYLFSRYQSTVKASNLPSFTIKASIATDGKGAKRNKYIDCFHDGKLYSLSTKAIARLMTVPDSYWLPDDNHIAVKVLGNGVPPLFAKQLFELICDARDKEAY